MVGRVQEATWEIVSTVGHLTFELPTSNIEGKVPVQERRFDVGRWTFKIILELWCPVALRICAAFWVGVLGGVMLKEINKFPYDTAPV